MCVCASAHTHGVRVSARVCTCVRARSHLMLECVGVKAL